MPTEYRLQVQGLLLITGREWCDFIAYYPDGVPEMIERVLPDEEVQQALREGIEAFNKRVDEFCESFERLK